MQVRVKSQGELRHQNQPCLVILHLLRKASCTSQGDNRAGYSVLIIAVLLLEYTAEDIPSSKH